METTQATEIVQKREPWEDTLAEGFTLTLDASGISSQKYALIAAYISGMVRGSVIGDLITHETLFARCVECRDNPRNQLREYFVPTEMLDYLQRVSDVKMGGDDA